MSSTVSISPQNNKSYMKKTNDNEPEIDYSKKLTSYQLEKLTKWFDTMLDTDNDGFLSPNDIDVVADRLIPLGRIANDSVDAVWIRATLHSILEALLENVEKGEKKTSLSRQEFLSFFGKLSTCNAAAGVKDFPYYIQMLPRIFFKSIGGGRKVLEAEDLKRFYRSYIQQWNANSGALLNMDDVLLDSYANRAYNAMTGNSTIPLTYDVYGLVFANFLSGRCERTPGKFVLPCFDVDGKKDEQPYKIEWI